MVPLWLASKKPSNLALSSAAPTFNSTPTPVAVPSRVARAPSNGGIEGFTLLPDGRLLALTEEFENPDGSFKGWLLDGSRFVELSYLPAEGFRVTDCAALTNGDVLVLERRYVPFGILSARLTWSTAKQSTWRQAPRRRIAEARAPAGRGQLRRSRRSRNAQRNDDLSGLRRQLQPVSAYFPVAVPASQPRIIDSATATN